MASSPEQAVSALPLYFLHAISLSVCVHAALSWLRVRRLRSDRMRLGDRILDVEIERVHISYCLSIVQIVRAAGRPYPRTFL